MTPQKLIRCTQAQQAMRLSSTLSVARSSADSMKEVDRHHFLLHKLRSKTWWRSASSMFPDDGDENESIIAHKAPMIGLHVCYNPAQPGDMFMGSTFVTTLLRRVAGALVFFIAAGISRRFLDAA